MRPRLLAWLASVGVAAALAGCVSLKRTPEARFFVLRPIAEAPPATDTPAAAGLVGLLPVVLPGYIDRPQLVSWVAPGELRIDEYVRWAEPLDAGVARTLAANLQVLLPESRVIRSPWPSAARVRCRVRVELQRFGPQTSGEVRLEGRFALLPPDGERPLVARPVAFTRGPHAVSPAGLDPMASVEAMSDLLEDLAREVAAAVGALPSAADAPSPGPPAPR